MRIITITYWAHPGIIWKGFKDVISSKHHNNRTRLVLLLQFIDATIRIQLLANSITKTQSQMYLMFTGVNPCSFKSPHAGTSLVAQWLRIHLPMQGTQVRALVREDPTCYGATKPVSHNYWACTLEPVSHNYWARVPQLRKPTHLEPVVYNKSSHRNEKPTQRNEE